MDIRINAHFGTIINFAFITVKRKITGLKQVLWQMNFRTKTKLLKKDKQATPTADPRNHLTP